MRIRIRPGEPTGYTPVSTAPISTPAYTAGTPSVNANISECPGNVPDPKDDPPFRAPTPGYRPNKTHARIP